MIASCSNVADADGHIEWELPLDIDRILLYSRSFSILIDVTDRCADAAQSTQAVAGWTDNATWERVIERNGWNWRALRGYSVLSKANLPVVVVRRVGNRIIVRRPEHTITAAHNRLGIEGIRYTHAGRPLCRGWIALVCFIAAHTRVHQTAVDLPRGRSRNRIGGDRHTTQTTRGLGVKTHCEVIVFLTQTAFMLRTKAVVQCQLRGDSPVVLPVSSIVISKQV